MLKLFVLVLSLQFNAPVADQENYTCEAIARQDCKAMDLPPEKCRLYRVRFVADCEGTLTDL